MGHLDGHEMVKFMNWAQGILTLQPDVCRLVADVHPIFKAHLLLGMTIFLVFPFTRLVHVWSAPVWYLGRRGYQIVRQRPAAPPRAAAAPSNPRSEVMGCSVQVAADARPAHHRAVNGVVIPHDVIAREAQNHPAADADRAWQRPPARSSCASCCCRRRAAAACQPEPRRMAKAAARHGGGGADAER